MALPLTKFARQVDFLRRHYALLSLDGAVEQLRSGTNDAIAASITFDDGYRDNTWAIEYLRYFGIPATFFVSIGHIRDDTTFQHDRNRGYEEARPMSEQDVRRLAADGFTIGSHAIYHEDFGSLTVEDAEQVLRQSRDLLCKSCEQDPIHFSFPKGQRGTNITEASYRLALEHFPYIFSAYGGYCYPQRGRRHFVRNANPVEIDDLGMIMSGYTGFRQCLTGNGWGVDTDRLDPYSAAPARSGLGLGISVLGVKL
jgi:peptidoglycan/xylan/chitin deacetylase (PgdA/CDA1 family)